MDGFIIHGRAWKCWVIFACLLFCISGCALLVFPCAGLVGHTIQKSNEEYDNIIVNYSFEYKRYYFEREELNKSKLSKGEQPEKILTFSEWLGVQEGKKDISEKERKAIQRYHRIHQHSP